MNIPDDPVIQELIGEFVDTWIMDLDEQFTDLIEQKNDQDLYRLAHTLKGSCYQFGLDEIAVLGIELMGHAKNKDFETAATFEKPLKDGFAEVKKMLENK